SILPDQDCCSLFIPAHPETRARIEQVLEVEARFEIERMVEDAVRRAEVTRHRFPQRATAEVDS
ncbi:MAG: tRNA uracil 4-sulfurtransferase ThiI, partial [Candidatus Binataceae bacterium]